MALASVHCSPHHISQVLHLQRMLQLVERGLATHHQGHTLPWQDIESIVGYLRHRDRQNETHTSRASLLAFRQRQRVALRSHLELRANLRCRQLQVLRFVEEHPIARDDFIAIDKLEHGE